ncbi:uncharacterized protein LOC128190472 isoform X2 [Crassostrea angulata]|uniref:uncharacterized protein LOC128190472 isoform X2 n=1 Tax=Magallana angulata TaxID=2784310 RepID=UPI0022B1299A|nr:uncharacterized protein LOC128190472 isoform X2 [Crassostrea angulata]
MGFQMLFGAFLMLIFKELHCFECHGNPDAYIDRGDRYCQKVYNCQPGHEIIDCSVNCESDRCSKCPHGQVQPFLIQSTTPEVDRKCFPHKGDCDQDSVPVRNGSSVPGCSKSKTCQCNLYDCYGGNTCTCKRFRGGCPVNEYFVYEGGKGGCKKCPPGTKKEIVGCGPCKTIPVTPDTNISTTTATTEKLTTAATEKSSTTSGLFINHNYLAISARKAESIGFSTLTSEMTTLSITTTSTEEKENNFWLIIIGSVSGFLILVLVGVIVVCLRRSRSHGGILNEAEKREENADGAENEIETVSRPLIVPEVSLLSEACSTPRSPVVSETGQPGVYHPTDPRALWYIRALQGRSLEDESHTDSSMNTSVEDRERLNSSCIETPAVDSKGNSEGVNYIINKLNNEDTQPKQPVQCEEDTLGSHTVQKYLYSDVTHQKEVLCEQGFHSLTNEKSLCPVRCVSDKTDPKYCTNS